MKKKELGNYGEAIGQKILEAHGLVLLQKNIRTPFGEIDLLMKNSHTLVAVEIKTRSSKSFGFEESLSPEQLIRLRKGLNWYSYQQSWKGITRIDYLVLEIRNTKLFDHYYVRDL